MSNDALAEKGSDAFRAGHCHEGRERARRRFTEPSPHSRERAASCAQEFERVEAAAAVASSRVGISSTWSLAADDDGRDAGGHERERSEEPKRKENMEKKDQSARSQDLSVTIFEICE